MYNSYNDYQSTENSATELFDTELFDTETISDLDSFDNSLSMKESYGSYGRNYRYNGNKYKKNKKSIKIKNKPRQKFKYSRDKKSSDKLSAQTDNLFKKDVDLTKTKIDKDYSMRTSKRKLPKGVILAGRFACVSLFALISLKIMFRKRK
jgi:hypothetical protein